MGSKPSKLSASRGAAVLGLSKWSTQFEVFQKVMEEQEPGWNAKQGYVLPEFKETAVLRWGLCFEDAVIKLSEEAQGCNIIDQERFFHYGDFITCHIDGLYNDPADNILHEGKTTSAFIYRKKWGEPGTDKVPRDCAIQVQHQMLCTGADETIVSVLVFPKMVDEWEKEGWEVIFDEDYGAKLEFEKNNDPMDPYNWANILNQMGYFHQYSVKRNQPLIDLMVEKYTTFWNDHVLTGKPPKAQDYDDIKRMCPEPVGTIIATEQLERWATEYKEIGQELGTKGILQKRRDQLKVLILNWMRQQDAVMDEASRDKTLLMDSRGHKLISYNGRVFR